jgi:hypothetical protein
VVLFIQGELNMFKIKTVNKLLKLENLKMELVKGEHYFYFIGDDVNIMLEGVYVDKLNDLTLAQWINEAHYRIIKDN